MLSKRRLTPGPGRHFFRKLRLTLTLDFDHRDLLPQSDELADAYLPFLSFRLHHNPDLLLDDLRRCV